ncbi:MAG: GTP-binding protein [Leptospiraceae bacterium]|nr:GTP-binding protein [Leptospiraceae bacterium]MCP5512212.1 GTP-binding protein [Leptospiraceae bacterium]
MDMLRILTAGSVDDGKSTLIGRLLFDSKSIFEDQIAAIRESSEKRGDAYTNLALLTDGLKAEREQGITIDVAYKYFATPKRKFIIADTPGHIQYTRNMVTGASTANLAVLLVDARKGISEQTRRHTFLVSLLGIPHIILCINKMDLVNYSEEIFESIQNEYTEFSKKLGIRDLHCIPISALQGDNVVERSQNMNWYKKETVLEYLESVPISEDWNYDLGRMSVQWVIRPMSDEHHDYRGYAGQISAGIFRKGDPVVIYPSGLKTTIKAIDLFDREIEKAGPPLSVTIRLENELDISRGDLITTEKNPPIVSNEIITYVCWMDTKPLQKGGKYFLQHGTSLIKCIILDIVYKIDISTIGKIKDINSLELNDIARVIIKTSRPLVYDDYFENRSTGSFILIDELTNNTSGAGMITSEEFI